MTIRLLDPPLHEFLPDRFELYEEIVRARMQQSLRLAELGHQLERSGKAPKVEIMISRWRMTASSS